jgi:mitochondrial fission protein ELM1
MLFARAAGEPPGKPFARNVGSMTANQALPPRAWALLGARRGDNNQVLALAEALNVPFEVKALRYNPLRHLQPGLLGATFRSLTVESRALVSCDWPDLTISTGHRSVPVVQAIRKASNGRTRSVHIGYPRISPKNFDLVVATPEYPIVDHPNLVRIPLALTRATAPPVDHSVFWDVHPSPRRLLVIGGPTLYWRLDPTDIQQAIEQLCLTAFADGGSVIVIGSPRTPPKLLAQVDSWIEQAQVPSVLMRMDGLPGYGALLAHADSVAVTADSVAMISDAVAAKKPVGLVPVQPTLTGSMMMGLMDHFAPGERVRPRDLRHFWSILHRQSLAGTVIDPKLGKVPDLTRVVAARVRTMLRAPGMG